MTARTSNQHQPSGNVRAIAYRSMPQQHASAVKAEWLLSAARPGPSEVTSDLSSGHQQTGDAELELNRLRAELERQKNDLSIQMLAAEERGRLAAEQAAQQHASASVAQSLEQVRHLVANLERQTAGYLADVERKVVDLALDISGRILCREVQIDPLLLAGAVHVALGKMRFGTRVRLRVPEADRTSWEKLLSSSDFADSTAGKAVTVTGEAEMSAGECVCEVEGGSVDLGIRSQSLEVERAFLSLLDQRKGDASKETRSEGSLA